MGVIEKVLQHMARRMLADLGHRPMPVFHSCEVEVSDCQNYFAIVLFVQVGQRQFSRVSRLSRTKKHNQALARVCESVGGLEGLAHCIWSEACEEARFDHLDRAMSTFLAQSAGVADADTIQVVEGLSRLRQHRRSHRANQADTVEVVGLPAQLAGRTFQAVVYDDVIVPPMDRQTEVRVREHVERAFEREFYSSVSSEAAPETNEALSVNDLLNAARMLQENDVRLDRIEPLRDDLWDALSLAFELRGASPEVERRGEQLLLEYLSPAQKKQYQETGSFTVVGCATGKTYRINKGRQQNIHELGPDGRAVQGWCFLPAGNLCVGDTMLGQKIALEIEEEAALRVAHPFTVRGLAAAARRNEEMLDVMRTVSASPVELAETYGVST